MTERIIGYVFAHNKEGKKIAIDLYEGNYAYSFKGKKITSLSEEDYKKLWVSYKNLDDDVPIQTAFDWNQANNVADVPEQSADPQAAEKEMKIREQEKNQEYQEKLEADRREDEEKAARLKEEHERNDEERLRLEKQQEREQKKEEYNRLREDLGLSPEDIPINIEELPQKVSEKDQKRLKKEKRRTRSPEEKQAGKEKKYLSILLIILIIAASCAAILWLLSTGMISNGFNSGAVQTESVQTEDVQAEDVLDTEDTVSGYTVIKLVNDVSVSRMITADDVTGVILTEEQYQKYSAQTYIDSSGAVSYMEPVSYESIDDVVGQYATNDLYSGSLLYSTDITSQHVIADKTYVEVTVDGVDGTYEVESDVLPGNTDIKIIAVITTDGGEQTQILLSEMKLQDRSLESIFNSAGQDILAQLAGTTEDTETEETQEQTE